MIRIGVIGFGYWGPNIVRNFLRVPNASISWVCDVNPKILPEIRRRYPWIATTNDPNEVFTDPTTNAVVIVTPTSTHLTLAIAALSHGKHVLIEKPMTIASHDATKLTKLAKQQKKILMVDHTFVYTPEVQKIKSIIDKKLLGDVFYVDCIRANLGLLQKDTNVIYDLATHDFAILDYLFGMTPLSVTASGFVNDTLHQEAVAHISATYPKGLFVHSHVSWLSPVKLRRMTFVGTKKMLLYDDTDSSEKIKMFDKSISVYTDPKQVYQMRIGYRIGTTVAPHIDVEEGLYGVATTFIRSIRTGTPSPTDGLAGTRIVSILEAATNSLRNHGKSVTLS